MLSAADDNEEEPSVEQLEGELAEAESDLEQLEDRARRAGVPPGWLR
jgi:multidrug resistance efflux pump